MSNGKKKNLNDELLRQLKERAREIHAVSRGSININIRVVSVAMVVTVADEEFIVDPIYIEDFVPHNELLVEIDFDFNGKNYLARANLTVRPDKIEVPYVPAPEELDIDPKEAEKETKLIQALREAWDITKAVISALVIIALKTLLNIDP